MFGQVIVCVKGCIMGFFFFKQKTAYEMRISDWSSDVCSSDLAMVATPTFFLFLLAPLFMVGMGLVGGVGASQLADSARGAGRIVAKIGRASCRERVCQYV